MIPSPFNLLLLPILLLYSLPHASARECADLDIRNEVASLKVLNNCTVVHGFLQIVLMDNPDNDFKGLSFPELREITGFLMLFRVFGLTTLGDLFPNLVIIRGATLFADYGLILYGLPDLQQIGLRNLLSIERGFVRIELCPKLCYASSIDWALITHQEAMGNVVPKDSETCANVTRHCATCEMPGRCWSYVNCQKKIGGQMTTLIHGNCNTQCLGKCHDQTANGCTVCKNVSFNGTCMEECPSNTILNQYTNRCVTEDQCKQSSRVIHNRECISECPPDFMLDKLSRTCVRCKQRCPKFCAGTLIEFLSTAQDLKGCTVIQGNLLIKLSSDVQNIEQELERHLGDIEEIEGYLKIYRSTSITTLSFLRGLKVIHGRKLDSDKFAFILFDNQNLKKLLDFSNRDPLIISNGALSVHYNYKLCQSEIESFRQNTNVQDHPQNNLPLTNAASGHCDFQPIRSDYQLLSPYNLSIFWEPFRLPDNSSVAVEGYTLYYMETTRDNLNWYNGRESCSTYSWKTKSLDVGRDLHWDEERQMHFLLLDGLKQVTKYAFYVRSYQSQPNSVSGQSVVKYFTTPLDTLTPPVVTTFQKGETSITLNWRVPVKEREFIRFFHVDVLRLEDRREWLDLRNYCLFPVDNDPVEAVKMRQRELREDIEECNCDESLNEDEFVNVQMQLYDSLRRISFGANSISCNDKPSHAICEAYENKRFKRTLHAFQRKFVMQENHTIDKREVTRAPNYFKSFRIEKQFDNFTIGDLQPFTKYAFEFFSCHSNRECSPYFSHVERTNPNMAGDSLRDDDLTVISDGEKTITLLFKEPEQANGPTLGFKVEQRVLGRGDSSNVATCLTRLEHEKNNYSFVVDNLAPKIYKYMFRVRSFSLALEGPWTEWKAVSLKDDEVEEEADKKEAVVPSRNFNIVGSLVVLCIVSLLISGGIYSYRSFNCLRSGDDAIYLMSELERDQEQEDPDFFPVDFSRREHDSSSSFRE